MGCGNPEVSPGLSSARCTTLAGHIRDTDIRDNQIQGTLFLLPIAEISANIFGYNEQSDIGTKIV